MTNTKNNPAALREQLEKVFAHFNQINETAANKKFAQLEANDITVSPRFKEVWDNIIGALYETLASESGLCIKFMDGFFDKLTEVLSEPVCVTYDYWAVRGDLTDDELRFAARAIAAKKGDQLESLRDQSDCERILAIPADATNMNRLIKNLQSLVLAFAHNAKHYDAVDAGRKLLAIASRLRRVAASDIPRFDEGEVYELVADFRCAWNDIKIAYDYQQMVDWNHYRKATLKRFGKAFEQYALQLRAANEAANARMERG